jgi:hypothetical protein
MAMLSSLARREARARFGFKLACRAGFALVAPSVENAPAKARVDRRTVPTNPASAFAALTEQ